MTAYATFLGVMSVLFIVSSGVLLVMGLVHLARRRGRRAAAYLALTILAGVVAAGFYFFRGLI